MILIQLNYFYMFHEKSTIAYDRIFSRLVLFFFWFDMFPIFFLSLSITFLLKLVEKVSAKQCLYSIAHRTYRWLWLVRKMWFWQACVTRDVTSIFEKKRIKKNTNKLLRTLEKCCILIFFFSIFDLIVVNQKQKRKIFFHGNFRNQLFHSLN